jgi:zinc/manganese transport system substrate-binding protein
MKTVRHAALIGLSALLLLSACGSSGGSATAPATEEAPESTPVATAEAREAPESTATVDGTDPAPRPTVVVTYSVLGEAVREIVGDAADVRVIIPNGQDPHDFAASPQDIQAIRNATLVVANGGDLEEGLADALSEAATAGVPVFYGLEHIKARTLSDEEVELEQAGHSDEAGDDEAGDSDEAGHSDEEGNSDEEGHSDGALDPHYWTSPTAMSELAPELAGALGTAIGVDLSAQGEQAAERFAAVNAQVRSILDALPPGGCRLVTGHESLGYFADEFDCELIGAVIPSLSSTAQPSARDLADLRRTVSAASVPVIFTEPGTNPDVVEQIADSVGARVVELNTHGVPDGGTYADFVTGLATTITNALR